MWTRRAVLGLLGGVGVWACGRGEAAPDWSRWQRLGEGLEAKVWEVAGVVQGSAVRADPGRWRLRVLPAPEGELRRVDAGWAAEAGAVVACNGGFFDAARRPMGLRVDEGAPWSPLLEADQGIFWGHQGRVGVDHVRQWARGGVQFAVQAGPRLVVEGAPLRLRPNLAARTVLGVDAQGWLALVVTRGAVALNPLAEALCAPTASGGLGLRAALNLDGGPSSQVVFPRHPRAQRALGIEGVGEVADMVALVAA